MGRQTVHFALGMSGLSGVLLLIGLCLPLHSKSFFLVGVIKIFSMRIWAGMGRMDHTTSDLCTMTALAGTDLKACEELLSSNDLHDINQRMCTTAMRGVFKNGCVGTGNAYVIGWVILILAIVNILIQGVATWLLYHYMYHNPKKQYREVALTLVCVGTSLVAIALAAYYPLVVVQLDNMQAPPLVNFVIDSSVGAAGVYGGYWVMWMAVIVQVVQIVLYKFSKISDERRLVELKMQEQFEAELAISAMGEDGDWRGDYGGHGGGFQHPPGPYDMQQPAMPCDVPPSWGPALATPGYGEPQGYGAQPGYGQQQQQGYPAYNAY